MCVSGAGKGQALEVDRELVRSTEDSETPPKHYVVEVLILTPYLISLQSAADGQATVGAGGETVFQLSAAGCGGNRAEEEG